MAEVRVGRWQDTLPGTYDPERTVVVADPHYAKVANDAFLTERLTLDLTA